MRRQRTCPDSTCSAWMSLSTSIIFATRASGGWHSSSAIVIWRVNCFFLSNNSIGTIKRGGGEVKLLGGWRGGSEEVEEVRWSCWEVEEVEEVKWRSGGGKVKLLGGWRGEVRKRRRWGEGVGRLKRLKRWSEEVEEVRWRGWEVEEVKWRRGGGKVKWGRGGGEVKWRSEEVRWSCWGWRGWRG